MVGDTWQELAATLQSVSEEKEKVEQRNTVLEKMVTMQIPPEPSVCAWTREQWSVPSQGPAQASPACRMLQGVLRVLLVHVCQASSNSWEGIPRASACSKALCCRAPICC